MKKLLAFIFCAALSVAAVFGVAGCDKNSGDIEVVVPDGAPALAFAQLMYEDDDDVFGKDVDYEVVNPEKISTYVTGKKPEADICVLPVNLACKLLGTGDAYKLLGTVTKGNLFLLSDGADEVTKTNLSEKLLGKTVGVIQFENVPGLTFRAILSDNGVPYKALEGGSAEADKVNLKSIQPGEAVSGGTCDYYVVPEPVATQRANATPLEIAASLQQLYGDGDGYPQAVMVAKKSLIENDGEFIGRFIAAVTANVQWLTAATPEQILGAVSKHTEDGYGTTLNAQALSAEVIEHCAVRYIPADQCKDSIKQLIGKYMAINPAASSAPADAFFAV